MRRQCDENTFHMAVWPKGGKGAFVKLIKYLKGKRKKTVVIAPSDRLSDNLEEAANQVIYLEDLEKEISM